MEEEHFWARPTSTKVGTELTKVGTDGELPRSASSHFDYECDKDSGVSKGRGVTSSGRSSLPAR